MKLNFFARIYLAITDFRLYPYIVQKEKFINALAYFVGFIALISAILATGVTSRALGWANEFIEVYNSKVSEFSINNGELVLDENMDFDFLGARIYADDSISFEDFNIESFDSKDCNITFLMFKDAFAVGNENVGFVFSKYNELGLNIDKAETYAVFQSVLKSPVFKLSLAGMITCAVFAMYFCTKLLNAFFIAIMLLFLGFVFRTKYKFKDYMKVAFYVVTLPIITEVIALMVTGSMNEYAYITYYLLVYVYMYYAIRALKLDDIIMSTQEKIFGMKMNNSSATNQNDSKEDDKQDGKLEDKKDENEKLDGNDKDDK